MRSHILQRLPERSAASQRRRNVDMPDLPDRQHQLCPGRQHREAPRQSPGQVAHRACSTAVIQQTQGLEVNQLKANGLDSGLSDFPNVEAYTSSNTAQSNSSTAIPHQYMCFVCARDFNDSLTLQSHMEQCLLENASILSSAPRHTNADDSPSYSCPVCQVECQDESSLHIHVDMCLQSAESSDLTTPYTCPICQLQFDDEGILHAHVDSCLSDEPTDVVTSNSPGMRGAGELNGGLSAPSSPRPSYLCPLCESVFSSMDELADHKAHCSHGCSRETRAGRDEATAAVSEFQVRAADTVNLGEFALNTCPACRLTFADTACYLSHIPQCTPEDSSAFSQANLSGFPPNTCPDCRQTFANSACYQSHIPQCSPDDAVALLQENVAVNLDNTGEDDFALWHECERCRVSFLDFNAFQSHVASCTEERTRRRKLCTIL
ncbi:zinc finger protein 774-like [Ptychodera flava]|uniref:zinc finger protein 774-like n=1 Tax=Ptychodera flava TaxID=63121 RepID=UPI00396A6D21